MESRRLTPLVRRVAHPLSAALLVAALGVTTAFLVLALRGHFSGVPSRPPVVLVIPTPTTAPASSANPSPTPVPSGPQTLTGTLASTVVIPLSSDSADAVTIPAGTQIQAKVTQQNGQLTVLDLIAGQAPPPGKSENKQGISGSTASTTTVTLTGASGSLPLTIAQDSAVTGTDGRTIALEITAPGP
jgi:hypothetical protein